MIKRKEKSTRKKLRNDLFKVFSIYIRLRDGKCCTPHVRYNCSDVLTCGHLFTRADQSTAWDDRFSFAQCSTHNMMHEYHPEIMTDWFIKKFGLDLYKEGVRITSQVYKPTLGELKVMIESYKLKIEAYERELQGSVR